MKLMVDENDTISQTMEISGASNSTINRWKQQYFSLLKSSTPVDEKALTSENSGV